METLYRTLDHWRTLLGRGALMVCILLFLGCLVLLALDILLRYAFSSPIQQTSEIVSIAFIYVYLLGAAALYARNEDISLDFIFKRFGVSAQAIWLLFIYLGIAVTMAVVCVETLTLMEIQKSIPTPLLRLPLAVEHAALAIASLLIAFTSLTDALHCWIWFRRGERPPRPDEDSWVV